MTSTRSDASELLPVSILAGPAIRTVLPTLIANTPRGSFALLTDSTDASQNLSPELIVEALPPASQGGRNLADLREQIITLAGKESVQHLLIECDSQTHPMAFASTFLPHGPLSTIARLNRIVLAIDANSLVDSIVYGRPVDGVISPCILADQIESSDSIVLIGDSFELAGAVAGALNPRMNIRQELKSLEGMVAYDFEGAVGGAGWRRLMDAKPGLYRFDQGVATFLYRARRPFHPEKFWNLLQTPFPGIFRAKGFFWLATRMEIVGGLNIAGYERHFSPAGEWWAADPDHGHTSEVPDRIKSEWEEPFGDRRQAIAFMGIDIDADSIIAQLDACLLTDDEMKLGEQGWATLPDPFPEWTMGHHHHDHECDDEGCCHH